MSADMVTLENYRLFAVTNEEAVKGPVRAIATSFHGMNFVDMRDGPDEFECGLGAEGVLTIFPYYGPWSYMNFQSVQLVDKLVALIREKHGLGQEVPLISTGASMGGLGALIYSLYAAETPVACVANCPICDIMAFATGETHDLKTLCDAFAYYDCGVERAARLHSPLYQAENMPRIPYYVLQGTEDTLVPKERHADRFVERMRALGHEVTYRVVPGMGHCDFPNEEVRGDYIDHILRYRR
jgi:dienelactone hydrolase